MELWLSEMEGQLMSEDCGKDLTAVQNLLKKQALLEADIGAHQVCVPLSSSVECHGHDSRIVT